MKTITAVLGLCSAIYASVVYAKPSDDAASLLDEAIAELRENHVNRARVDWSQITASAHAAIEHAQNAEEAYPAIRQVIAALGEKHTMFHPAVAAAPAMTGLEQPKPAAPRPPRKEPQVRRLPGGIGHVSLPGWPFNRDHPTSEAWVTQARTAMMQADAEGVCGWIVDVRDNGGGNLWPMLDILGPLLGAPPFGAFVVKTREPILYEAGRATYAGQLPTMPALAALKLRSATTPVAVLMNGKTASSAENVVMMFKGRDKTRFFGAATANYVSVNNPKKLKDGSIITTTVGYTEDRTGFAHTDAIQPDVPADDAAVIDIATSWLNETGCERSAADPK